MTNPKRLTDATSANHITEEELQLDVLFAALGFNTRQATSILGISTEALEKRYRRLLHKFPQPSVGLLVLYLLRIGLLQAEGNDDLPQVMQMRLELFHTTARAMKTHGLNDTHRGCLLSGIRSPQAEARSSIAWKSHTPPNYARSILAIIGRDFPQIPNPSVFMAAAAVVAGEL